MEPPTCPECDAPAHYHVDDVVTGDTVCTQCGFIIDDRIAGLFSEEQSRYTEHNTADRENRRSTTTTNTTNTPTATPCITSSFENICDHLLKQLSRICVDITRNNRIVLRNLCITVAEKHPDMLFKAPASIVLAVFVCYTKPSGRLRGLNSLSSDKEFSQLCNSLHVKPSSVYGMLRKVDKTLDHAIYSRIRGRSKSYRDRS